MFGTIGHAQPKPGTQSQLDALMEEWKQTIRPQIDGPVLELIGRPKDRPDEVVFVALMKDEATYRKLAENPEQDQYYRRLLELMNGDITWEDVEMEIAIND